LKCSHLGIVGNAILPSVNKSINKITVFYLISLYDIARFLCYWEDFCIVKINFDIFKYIATQILIVL